MTKIKRYDQGSIGMRPDPDGAWCEYDEVAAEIERLRRLWDSTDAELRARDKLAISQQAKIERLRKEVEAKDLLLSEWLGEDKAQLEIERLRRLVAEKEAQLSQIPCRYNRCVQYDDAKNEIVRLREENTKLWCWYNDEMIQRGPNDIVEKLHKWEKHEVIGGDCFNAANEIRRLRSENAELLKDRLLGKSRLMQKDLKECRSEIERLRKELNRTRDAVDLWADNARAAVDMWKNSSIEYKQKIDSLLDLLRDANKIDAGDFSVNVDEWFARVREAVERG